MANKNDVHQHQADDRLLELAQKRLWVLLSRLWHPVWEGRLSSMNIREVRIRGPREEGGQVLCIIKAEDEHGRFVAFHAADSAVEAVRGTLERVENGSLKWKEDVWADGKFRTQE